MDAVWRRDPDARYEVVDGQAIVLDAEGQELTTLNAVGTIVWEVLDGRTVDELVCELAPRFRNARTEDLAKDFGAFLAELDRLGLVVRLHAPR